MEKQKRSNLRFTDVEMQIIKDVFADNIELLQALRKVFLQMPLDVVDKDLLLVCKKPEVLKVIRKAYLPELDAHAPIHQMADLWMFAEIKGKKPDEAYIELVTREKVIAYLDQQLNFLKDEKTKLPIVLADAVAIRPKAKAEEMLVDFMFRNMIISHNEAQLQMFDILAGQTTESIEETKKRLAQNSSK